jgi:hypothetical protein
LQAQARYEYLYWLYVFYCRFHVTFQRAVPKFVANLPIDNSHYRLILKLGKEMQINHHSYKEHTKISEIAKFGCEML